jgi:hypothetical protein
MRVQALHEKLRGRRPLFSDPLLTTIKIEFFIGYNNFRRLEEKPTLINQLTSVKSRPNPADGNYLNFRRPVV